MKQITIHSDGACEGNPGPGGWAAILRDESDTRSEKRSPSPVSSPSEGRGQACDLTSDNFSSPLGGEGGVRGGKETVLSGGEPITTNNRMELQAAIEALHALHEPSRVEFFTDSVYLRDGITSWIAGWKQRGWMTTEKKPVKNADLWRTLDALAGQHQIEWRWVKGHAGNDLNERCDQLAVTEIAKLKQRYTPEQLKALLLEFQEREKRTEQLSLF